MLLRNPLPISSPAVIPAAPASTCLPIRLSSSPINLGSRSFSIVSIGMPWRTHSAVISWIMPWICEYALPAPSMSPVSRRVSKIPRSFDSFSPIAFAAASKLAVNALIGCAAAATAAFVAAMASAVGRVASDNLPMESAKPSNANLPFCNAPRSIVGFPSISAMALYLRPSSSTAVP